MDLCMNSNLCVISWGLCGSSKSVLDRLVSQYSNYWACDVKPLLPTPHLFCSMFFCMVHGMFCKRFTFFPCVDLMVVFLHPQDLDPCHCPAAHARDRRPLQWSAAATEVQLRAEVCVCLCVWVFEASLTSQEGLWPVWLLLWWWHTEIRGVLRSFFKYYLFLSLVHLFCFSCLWLEAMIVCHMKWSDFTLKSCNLFWHGIRLLDCWSHSMCAPER